MNREIKFRAWDARKESMWSPDYFKLRQDETGYYIVTSTGHGAIRGVELMQYTGLKDKNGKEIYEGDYLTNSLFRLRVDWDDGTGQWLTGESPLWYAVDDGSYEVTGNIYENPELLKK